MYFNVHILRFVGKTFLLTNNVTSSVVSIKKIIVGLSQKILL